MTLTARIEFVVKLVAAAIAMFGVWKYFADRQAAVEAQAKARSLAYIQRFADGDMVRARADLLRFWQRYPDFAVFAREDEMTEREYANFVRAVYPKDPERLEIDQALFRVLTFYDEVGYCRAARICDEEMLDSYFCVHVMRHAKVYAPFYARMSEEIGAEPMDATLRDFASQCRSRA